MNSNTLKIISKEESVFHVKSGNRVFIQGAAMTPNTLINALCERHSELENIEIIQLHTEGVASYTEYP